MADGPDSAWRNRAPGPHRNTARQAMDGLWTEVCGQQKQSNDPGNNQHILNTPIIGSAQPQHTNYWAPRTQKRHQQEHQPQRPTESRDLTQHAKGRTGDRPAPVKEQQPDRMSHRGAGGGSKAFAQKAPSSGEAHYCHIRPRSNGNVADCKVLGRRFESWLVDCRRPCRRHLRPTRVQTADQKVCVRLHYCSATACPENSGPLHCLEPGLPLTKNPNCVFLSD